MNNIYNLTKNQKYLNNYKIIFIYHNDYLSIKNLIKNIFKNHKNLNDQNSLRFFKNLHII